MGEVVLAAKITHVPSMFISELDGPNKGCRKAAIDGLAEIGARIRKLGTDTIVIADTHWLVNAGYHINANSDCSGLYTSTEFPHFIRNLEYDYVGDEELGQSIAETATELGTFTRCHSDIPSLGLQYGTLVPLKFMGIDKKIRIVSIAAWIYDAELSESRIMGEAVRNAIEASGKKVAFLASGSLSHRIAPNQVVDEHLFKNSSPFNEKTDHMVLDMWQRGEIQEFLKMLPQYARDCSGEGNMHDTAMLFGLLGWDDYNGQGEILTDYFPSSGTGQCNVVFPVT
ncbi:MAG: 3,4-dihydroxyphenylacetate 2,3-dioxygenase [Proteobacteria bacterium]|nr:3,4-dihydroxyphenylacetate 2,3-dioxygenase [Pseudomonadota bacterium]MDA0992618.1 3,4-dihydroxyphenylacetate 2,3-dioxygenase [Pseudomonadota bacterium]